MGNVIVGRLPDGEWVLHDGVVDLRDNAPAAPLLDGGRLARDQTDGVTPCANVHRTFLNADLCRLSGNGAACASRDLAPDGLVTLVCGSSGEASNDVTLADSDSWQMDCDVRTINPLLDLQKTTEHLVTREHPFR